MTYQKYHYYEDRIGNNIEAVKLPIMTGVVAAFLYGLPVWVMHPKFALADYNLREHTEEFEQENTEGPDEGR